MFLWLGVTVGFLFFWLIGLMSELQRSETIDLQRLMHLPVALGQMFLINYVTSLATISIVIAGPGLTGLALGLAISRGPLLLLLLPLAWAMIFMVSAWTYCLRGWLAAMMNNLSAGAPSSWASPSRSSWPLNCPTSISMCWEAGIGIKLPAANPRQPPNRTPPRLRPDTRQLWTG